MLIIHAVQKLLNTSRLKTALYVSKPDEGQLLHSWYARLLSTGFQGKLFVMYVHEPSLLTIVCRGKTINSTWVEFSQRLPHLLKRYRFPATFIAAETERANDFVVAKTENRSILSHMNQMVVQLEFDCSRFDNYECISQDLLEDRMMDYLYQSGSKSKPYITPIDYWKQRLVLR